MSWAEYMKSIKDVCEVIAGQSPEGKYYNKHGDGLPFYQGKKEFTDKYLGEPTTWTSKTTKVSIVGDILMSVRAPVGPVNVNTQNICIGRGLAAIRATEKINKEYLFYFLLKHETEIESNTGAVFNSINRTQIQNIQIPIPPLKEQHEIVKILDQAFVAIDQAKANIEKNIENAKELLESYLDGIIERVRINEKSCILDDYLDLITYGFTNPMPTVSEGPYMVTAKNVRNGVVDYENSRKTSQEAFDTAITDKSRPLKGDVLLTKDGTLGRLAVVEYSNMCINQSVALLRPKKELESYFLMNMLASKYYQDLMISQAGGTTIKHIYITRVNKMSVPLPSLQVQKDIVRKLNAFKERTQQLNNSYEKKLEDIDELKKSILQKAFAGELTHKTLA